MAIALLDLATPRVPLGFLYLFPVLLMAGFISRREIVGVAAICAVFSSVFSDYHLAEALSFSVMSWAGFSGTGLFVAEIVRSRHAELEHQQELQALVESSPLAIMIFGASGRIVLANDAAQNLLAPGEGSVLGQPITEFLPILEKVAAPQPAQIRTELRGRGKRKNGATFVAAIWVSTAATIRGPMGAAIIVDLSQDLRVREDDTLQALLTNAKVLATAMAHEVRNLCGGVRLTYKNLSRMPELQESDDFRLLGSLVDGLERLSAIELQPGEQQPASYVELSSVLDELRVIIEPAYREAGMEIRWQIPDEILLVQAERHGLLQVFLNLARNSRQAMQGTSEKQLTIRCSAADDSVAVRFEDTGTGIAHPENLFRPFQQGAASTGLGLYVSRGILKSFGGEIHLEPRTKGCCLAVMLQTVTSRED